MHLRSILAAFAVFAFAVPASGMSGKPALTVRFHTEANPRDGESFAAPVKLAYQRRAAYLNRVPAFSELQIAGIYPFPAGDGTWGCVFKLTPQGRIRLETLSSESRGSALVVFVGTKGGQHQVIDMVIDRQVSDGVITVPRGLTELEVLAMRKKFKVIGGETAGKEPEKKEDPTNWWMDRSRSKQHGQPPPPPPPPLMPSSKRRGVPEPDLPRLAD